MPIDRTGNCMAPISPNCERIVFINDRRRDACNLAVYKTRRPATFRLELRRAARHYGPLQSRSLMADLSVTVDGLKLPNPFIIASGPPGTNANVIGKAFDEGWGAVICKTVSLDASKVVNVQPRYGRLRTAESQEIIGWENIELISDRDFNTWIDEFKQIKDKYPDRVLIASIMEEYRKDAWVEIVERCQDAG